MYITVDTFMLVLQALVALGVVVSGLPGAFPRLRMKPSFGMRWPNGAKDLARYADVNAKMGPELIVLGLGLGILIFALFLLRASATTTALVCSVPTSVGVCAISIRARLAMRRADQRAT